MKLKGFLESSNQNKNIHMARFISLLIGIQGLFMAIVNTKNSNLLQVIIPLSYGILMLINFIYITFSRKLHTFYISAFIVIFYLEYAFLMSGGTDGFGLIWLTAVPLFTVYLLDAGFFYVTNSLFLIILMIFLWSPVNNYIYAFNESFKLRFPLVYALSFLFGSFLKYRIHKTEQDLEHQKNLLSSELHQAALIQETFFKQRKLDFPKWQTAFYNLPMAEVSGDLYDIYYNNDNLNGIGIFDISGHGIASGLITMLAKNIIRQEFDSNLNNNVDVVMSNLNNRFNEAKGEIENYLTGIIVKTKEEGIELVNAGHPNPIIYKAKENSYTILNRDPSSIGAIGIKYLPSIYIRQEIEFESNDEVILYTDGLLEYKNSNGEFFGIERLLKILQSHTNESPESKVEIITKEIKKFGENTPQSDDMTILILKKK